MKTRIIFVLLATVSITATAQQQGNDHRHHKSDYGRGGKVEDIFKHFDTDGDGKVSAEEHESAILEMAEKRRQRFSEMDANADGFISADEARSGADKRRKKWHKKMQKKLDKRFDMIDKDGDGKISKEEAKALKELRPPRS
mgnify:CR=1 FL=1